ncbi:MAG: hypothetical protein QME60_08900 [Verrucomicrobiota bacterium]|nr:hypothetical protein [Verrucomicrobiota bacterium]
MSESKKRQRSDKDLEAEVWNAITAFEQILEAMPNDRASLDALSSAYEQIGDHAKAKEYLARFGAVLADENDAKAADNLLEKLRKYAADDKLVQALIVRIQQMTEQKPAASAAVEKGQKAEKARVAGEQLLKTGFNMQEEMSFAWTLSEANQITQEEYANVVQDLSELSSAADTSTVSVLHVLENRGFKNLEKILAFVCKECGAPFVSLSTFGLTADAVSLLPLDLMRRRGTLVFELLGRDALVVVMNAYDKQLRKDVEALAGRKCHFFLTLPSEFDRTLEKIPEILAQVEPRK